MCPICVIGTGILMEFFRWLGVDDTIVGLWLGSFILSLVLFLNKQWPQKLKFQLPLTLVSFYALALLLLQTGGMFTIRNEILGINKTIFGIVIGSFVLLGSSFVDKFLRKLNNGKISISHQKVIVAIGLLLFLSLIFYLIIK